MTDWQNIRFSAVSAYMNARYDHAWLLRAEGLTFAAIGTRMGCSTQNARRLVYTRGRRVSWAMRRAIITVYSGEEPTGHTIRV